MVLFSLAYLGVLLAPPAIADSTWSPQALVETSNVPGQFWVKFADKYVRSDDPTFPSEQAACKIRNRVVASSTHAGCSESGDPSGVHWLRISRPLYTLLTLDPVKGTYQYDDFVSGVHLRWSGAGEVPDLPTLAALAAADTIAPPELQNALWSLARQAAPKAAATN